MAEITAKECNYILNNYIPTTRDPAESYLISLAQAYLDHEARVAELQEQIIIRDIIVNGAVEENNSLEAELAELRSENERLRAENDELRNVVEHPPSVEKFIDNLADSLVSAEDEIDRLRKQLSGNTGDVTPQQKALRKGEWA